MRGLGSILSIGAALAVAGLASSSLGQADDSRSSRSRREPWDERRRIPNDHGPVIDTTKESKRARRRRLAREAQS